jgi:hypothetical protein
MGMDQLTTALAVRWGGRTVRDACGTGVDGGSLAANTSCMTAPTAPGVVSAAASAAFRRAPASAAWAITAAALGF